MEKSCRKNPTSSLSLTTTYRLLEIILIANAQTHTLKHLWYLGSFLLLHGGVVGYNFFTLFPTHPVTAESSERKSGCWAYIWERSGSISIAYVIILHPTSHIFQCCLFDTESQMIAVWTTFSLQWLRQKKIVRFSITKCTYLAVKFENISISANTILKKLYKLLIKNITVYIEAYVLLYVCG